MNERPFRLVYVDNLRILLSSLVLLFHLSLTYGAAGHWPYIETEREFFGGYVLTLFTVICQSFFMGLFFLIAAYFTHSAFERKGAKRFVYDRVLRLGVPLAIFYFFVEPLNGFLAPRRMAGMSFMEALVSIRGRSMGALWFVAALICFTSLYVLARCVFPSLKGNASGRPYCLRNAHAIALILFLSVVTCLVRQVYDVGEAIRFLGFGLAHFPQYIVLFVLGIVASRSGIQDAVSFEQGKKWFWCALVMVVVAYPVLFFAGGALSGDVDLFLGGPHWQTVAFAFWEQITGISIMIGLLGVVKEKWNTAGMLARELSASAYAMYVFHPPILVAICGALRHWRFPPFGKFVVLSPVMLIVSFAAAALIRRLPGLRRVF